MENLRAVDRPAAAMARAVRRVLRDPRVDGAVGGSWLGHPLHPLMVTVPIGAWVCASVLDAGKADPGTARKLVGIGLVTAPPTILLGLADYSGLEGRQRRVGLVHAVVNIVAVTCFAVSYRLRRRDAHLAGRLVGLLGLAVLGTGGALGGHLSYAQGGGVYRWQPPAEEEAAPTDGSEAARTVPIGM